MQDKCINWENSQSLAAGVLYPDRLEERSSQADHDKSEQCVGRG